MSINAGFLKLEVPLAVNRQLMRRAFTLLLCTLPAVSISCEWLVYDFLQTEPPLCETFIEQAISNGATKTQLPQPQDERVHQQFIVSGQWHEQQADTIYSCADDGRILAASCRLQSVDKDQLTEIGVSETLALKERFGNSTHRFVKNAATPIERLQQGWELPQHMLLTGMNFTRRTYSFGITVIDKTLFSEKERLFYQQYKNPPAVKQSTD